MYFWSANSTRVFRFYENKFMKREISEDNLPPSNYWCCCPSYYVYYIFGGNLSFTFPSYLILVPGQHHYCDDPLGLGSVWHFNPNNVWIHFLALLHLSFVSFPFLFHCCHYVHHQRLLFPAKVTFHLHSKPIPIKMF